MRIGIIGCGGIAHCHARSILQLKEEGMDLDLTAVCDIERQKAEEFHSLYGGEVYTDYCGMLEKAGLDAVHICTPHDLHVPMALESLAHGIHVFTEKPPVISRQQWDELKSGVRMAADTADLSRQGESLNAEAGSGTSLRRNQFSARIGFCFQNRFNESVQYIRSILQSGVYGRIRGARGFVTWGRDADYYESSPWRGRLDREGGGALINQSIHTLDLLQYFIGEAPQEIRAIEGNLHLQDVTEVEDTFTAYIRYPEARAVLFASNAYVGNVPVIVDLDLEKAHIRMEETFVTIDTAEGERITRQFGQRAGFGKDYWGNGHAACIRAWYEALQTGTPFAIEIGDIENTVELLLDGYADARAAGQHKG